MTLHFIIKNSIRRNTFDFEEERTNKLDINNEVLILRKRETPSKARLVVQSIFAGSIIKAERLMNRLKLALKRKKTKQVGVKSSITKGAK